MTLTEKRALLSSWDTIIEMTEKNLEWAKEQRDALELEIDREERCGPAERMSPLGRQIFESFAPAPVWALLDEKETVQ